MNAVFAMIRRSADLATLRIEERYDRLDVACAYAISLMLVVIVFFAIAMIRPREVSD